MPYTTDKFYNLQIELVKNGQTTSEKAGISSISEKDDTAFFNVFIYRLDKSYIFEKHFITKIHDLNNDKIYTNINSFISEFKKISNEKNIVKTVNLVANTKPKGIDFLAPIYSDIVILLFFADNDVDDKKLKLQIVNEYILQKLPQANNLSPIYINKCLNAVEISKTSFYQSILTLLNKNEQDLSYFFKILIKICLSDGRLHYTERLYIAEIMQMFRQHNRELLKKIKIL